MKSIDSIAATMAATANLVTRLISSETFSVVRWRTQSCASVSLSAY